MTDIKQVVHRQRQYFKSGRTRDPAFRVDQLKKLKKILKSNERAIFDALRDDFRKPPFETYGTELGLPYDEIDMMTRKVPSWAKPEKVRGALISFPSRNYIYSQPYGAVLVIAAWNYPVQLSVNPAIGAIAAGNCTIIKPSEIAPHSSRVIRDLINEYFDPGFLTVIEGAAEETQRLLDQPLDYIFFTGSTHVGKIIMKKAAEQLTPITLELGGKSPAIVDETADLRTAAKRIAWGKFINAGQTCVAPDYLYAHHTVKDRLAALLADCITDFYGSEPSGSPDFARIINDSHFDRLAEYLGDGRIIAGGETDRAKRYIAPTVMDDVDWSDSVMEEEIFGPILPILEYEDLNAVIDEINKRPEPLALYSFSTDKANREKLIREISFGGGCINDTALHFGNNHLPLGGIGNSGFGQYHGKASFDLFSHKKSILKKPNWLDIPLRYPPYEGNLKWLRKIFN